MSIASPLGSTFGARLSDSLTSPEDFRKCRRRLNKSLCKLRHNLKIVSHKTESYNPPKVGAEQYNADQRYGDLLLLLAERYSLHALEAKSFLEIGVDGTKYYKQLMRNKLQRAATTTEQLIEMTKDEQSTIKKVEIFVYAALTEGANAIFRKQWDKALSAYSLARCGLELLLEILTGDESLFNKTLLEELIDTSVDPSLRLALSQGTEDTTADLRTVSRKFCLNNSLPHLAPLNDLIISVKETFFLVPKAEELFKTVNWRNHVAQIDNDALAFQISKLIKIDWKSFSDSNDYDNMYSQWQALVELHQSDLSKNNDEDDPEKVQNGAVLLTYLKYNMLFTKLKRDLLLIDQLNQSSSTVSQTLRANKDILRLYGSVISTVDELKDLPGVYNDEELSESLENMGNFFKAKQSVTVANSYALADKFAEALSVFMHLERVYSVDEHFYKVDAFPFDVASLEEAKELEHSIARLLKKSHVLAQFQAETQGPSEALVADDVFKFPTSGRCLQNIVNVAQKGKIAPVLSKAVLFDVAYNYISYTHDSSKPVDTENREESQDKKKSGFFGIFGR